MVALVFSTGQPANTYSFRVGCFFCPLHPSTPGAPVAPVLDRAEMLTLDHFRERGVVTADPWADPATGYPVRFHRVPAARTARPPGLDEHRGQGFEGD